MELSEILYQKTNDVLKQLARLCDGCGSANRKDDLVHCIHRNLMVPESLREIWGQLDDLSQKAVASAYHNDGHFNADAFIAQYGQLPERPQSRWFWQREPILLDLFIYEGRLPSDLMPLLEPLVPPPERFRLQGLANAPKVFVDPYGDTVELNCVETEQAGLHDLMAYLRLVDQEEIKVSGKTSRATVGSLRKVMKNLLDGDFLPLPDTYRATDTIRPFGLDVFVQEAGLAKKARGRNELRLTAAGQKFYQTQDAELLLDAFETWAKEGDFDELSRISALKGLNARGTTLTKPGARRDAVIEALSWCPVKVWIEIEDFYRALKIWHFDFEAETGSYTNLYLGSTDYGTLHGETYWRVVKGLYVNAVLWEYLGSIGAVDLLHTDPEVTELELYHNLYVDELPLSPYDGLRYFRINNLGAYLLGQAGEYVPAKPPDRVLFAITPDFRVTITEPDELTPNDQHLLEQMAVRSKNGDYRLDTERLLTALEEGEDLQTLVDFLGSHHSGPLPEEITAWLEKIDQNSGAFTISEEALFIKVSSAELAEMVMADSVLQKFCTLIDAKTLAIPSGKEKTFRDRLKKLEYVLL